MSDDAELHFPPGFTWGVATSAYQVEGSPDADGRGRSIWDTFSHTPGAVTGGDTGDVACDHYRRCADDVALLHRLAIQAYRFSVAWPRVQPAGRGPANAAGLDFYDRLVDLLLGNDVAPLVTLYHWDLPQALQDAGGWPARDTAHRFADYCELVAARLADRVRRWTTLNEPWCSTFLGYAKGEHAPGIRDPRQALRAVHHLLLGHGLAMRRLREILPGDAELSIVLNPAEVRPAADGEADVAAAAAIDGIANRIFLDPLLHGGYPDDVVAATRTAGICDWQHVQAGDLELIGAPIDALGVNYYTPLIVEAGTPPPEQAEALLAYPGCPGIRLVDPPGPRTEQGWAVDPAALVTLLRRIGREAPGIPLLVTENGAAYPDRPGPDGVADPQRTGFLHAHLAAVHEAIVTGVDVRGYFVWSFLDNFEWAYGYTQRFGLVHVDYPTQTRTPKHSALWYQEVIRRHAVPSSLSGTAHRSRITSQGTTRPRIEGASMPSSPTRGRRRTQPTLATVAAVAGVSPATVSRVINGSTTVALPIRAAVEEAISHLGYVPNRAARSLVTQRSDSIALVVREKVEFGVADAYLSSTIVAASQSLVGTGFQLVVMMASNDAEHAQLATYVRAGHVDGVILVSLHADDPLPQQLLRARIPTVLSGRPFAPLPARNSYVDVDNVGGGELAARRLIDSGRRRLATIAGPVDMAAATDRLAGFRATVAEAGLQVGAVALGDFHRASGEAAMQEILAREPQIDGVFAASDLMAAGALRVLRATGRSVPDDVAVIGFDDLELAQHTEPPLTTVHQPVADVIRTVTQMLIRQIHAGPVEDPVVLPVTLITRDSG